MSDYDSLFRHFWKWRMEESPYYASLCADESQSGRLDSWQPQVFHRRRTKALEFHEKFTNLNLESLSEEEKLNVEILLHALETLANGIQLNCQCFPMVGYFSPITSVNRMLVNIPFFTEDDLENAFKILNLVPRMFEEQTSLFREGIRFNLTFPSELVVTTVENLHRLTKTDVEFPLMSTFKERLACSTVALSVQDQMLARVNALIRDEIRPAISETLRFLKKDYSLYTRPHSGVGSLTNGSEIYSGALRFHIETEETPEEVHKIGLMEVERIETIIAEVISKTGFKGEPTEFYKEIAGRPDNFFQSPEDLLQFVQKFVFGEVIPIAQKYFPQFPDFPFEIRGNDRKSATGGFYHGGKHDKSSPGVFFVFLNSYNKFPKFFWPSLCLHESVPGHHLQSIFSLDRKDLPDFRRVLDGGQYSHVPARFPLYTAYAEGWGLYAEGLGEEMGIYSDPLCHYGKLQWELLRAVRLVVDTGIHAFGWSKQRAINFFLEKLSSYTYESASQEINRYIAFPGHACAYKMGEMKIWELRKVAEEKLCDKFDIKEFHSVILECGFVPITSLEKIVADFLKKKKLLN